MYGYKEAAHWWNKTLTKVFVDNGYFQMSKDRCVMVKTEGDKVSYCAITVDDCFFAITKDEEWIGEAINMLKRAFDELPVDRGETINILGMTVHIWIVRGEGLLLIKSIFWTILSVLTELPKARLHRLLGT